MAAPAQALWPTPLRPGDRVRFVSPASPPDRRAVEESAEILRSWGLVPEYGEHAFRRHGYLAGSDEERLADLNAALRDDTVRAVFATRGGKGSYRIADRLDFAAVRRDPKFLVGFSDITILHLSLWKGCGLIGLHGALFGGDTGGVHPDTIESLRRSLMTTEANVLRPNPAEPTAALTTLGACRGRLIGGNLEMVAAAAGWALPALDGAILFLEAVNMGLGQVDRLMTMLRKAGHLQGVRGVAVGQFTGFSASKGCTVVDVLRDHLVRLAVPILGGLPIGHGAAPQTVPIGAVAALDATAGVLSVRRG